MREREGRSSLSGDDYDDDDDDEVDLLADEDLRLEFDDEDDDEDVMDEWKNR